MEAMPDKDPLETTDWLDALRAVQQHRGAERANYLLTRLVEGARRMGDYVPPALTTAYSNTIPADREAKSPGDRDIEHRIRSYTRWNAIAMVLRAGKEPNSAATSPASSPPPRCMTSASTISGMRRRSSMAATWSTCRAMSRRVSTRARSSAV